MNVIFVNQSLLHVRYVAAVVVNVYPEYSTIR